MPLSCFYRARYFRPGFAAAYRSAGARPRWRFNWNLTPITPITDPNYWFGLNELLGPVLDVLLLTGARLAIMQCAP
jgi:hypothetical protein